MFLKTYHQLLKSKLIIPICIENNAKKLMSELQLNCKDLQTKIL